MAKLRSMLLATAGAAALAGSAHAASFFLRGSNTVPVGLAFAGQAVGADPSTVATNPAGMTRFSGFTVSVGAATVWGSRDFEGNGFSALGVPTGSDQGGNAYGPHVIPAGYAIYQPHPDWRLGLAVYSPFGLSTSWNPGWLGRYQGITSRLTTVNITPAVAWQPTSWLSLGVGFQAQYAHANLSNALDTGAQLGASTLFDSNATFRGDDWAFGWTVGLTVAPREGVLLGVSWRSQLTQDLSGSAEFAVNPAFLGTPIGATLANRSATAKLPLPGTLAVGASWDIHPRVTIFAEFQWQNWSRFNEIRVQFGPPPLADFVSVENYRDSVFAAVAAEWRISDIWAVRGGVGYDQTPTRDQFRSVRVPDGDQIILGVGASARLGRSATIDVGYAHFFARNASINNTSTTGDRVIGTARGDLNEVAVTLRLNY
jgi:long-chain fatty acid transport protein